MTLGRRIILDRRGIIHLQRISKAITSNHCNRIDWDCPMGYKPRWDSEDDRQAAILLDNLAMALGRDEALAMEFKAMVEVLHMERGNL